VLIDTGRSILRLVGL
jgi:hypothetical protein